MHLNSLVSILLLVLLVASIHGATLPSSSPQDEAIDVRPSSSDVLLNSTTQVTAVVDDIIDAIDEPANIHETVHEITLDSSQNITTVETQNSSTTNTTSTSRPIKTWRGKLNAKKPKTTRPRKDPFDKLIFKIYRTWERRHTLINSTVLRIDFILPPEYLDEFVPKEKQDFVEYQELRDASEIVWDMLEHSKSDFLEPMISEIREIQNTCKQNNYTRARYWATSKTTKLKYTRKLRSHFMDIKRALYKAIQAKYHFATGKTLFYDYWFTIRSMRTPLSSITPESYQRHLAMLYTENWVRGLADAWNIGVPILEGIIDGALAAAEGR